MAATASSPKYNFNLGESIEAKDLGSDSWWPAKILELDADGSEVLVHFVKFNNRHDEWISMDSPRLRSASLPSFNENGENDHDDNHNNHDDNHDTNPDEKKDMTQKSENSFHNSNKVRAVIKNQVTNVKMKPRNETRLATRRERKSKFNVKELLNIRQLNTVTLAKDRARIKNVKMSKEPLLKDSSSDLTITGKRERKRKRFWDEDTSSLPVRRRSSESRKSETSLTKTGKKLEYLQFDMSLDPSLIAKQMVEGINIPGPGIPIPVDSSNLPSGWEKRVIQRGLGVTKGKWDVFILNPTGKSFRSKTELQRHFDEKKLDYSIDSFDFSLDDSLKRLRQIWKQYVIKPNLKPGEKLSSPLPAKISRKSSGLSKASFSSSSLDNGDVSHQSSELDLKVGYPSETGQGLRCFVQNCGKLFRNDRLLQEHIKHYHPEFRDSSRLLLIPSLEESSEGNGKEILSESELSSNVVPPTFRVSKRRQKELQKKNASEEKSNERDKSENNDDVKKNENNVNENENDENEFSSNEHLTNEEIVNCSCGRSEEDGLMIQCDICLCWQHGGCLSIDSESEVPDKHVCLICKDPSGKRSSSLLVSHLDQDWLKEGKFPFLSLSDSSSFSVSSSKDVSSRENAFRLLSDLMAELSNLSQVLHSLRVKLEVARTKSSTKIFLWSSPWGAPNKGGKEEGVNGCNSSDGCGDLGTGGGGIKTEEDSIGDEESYQEGDEDATVVAAAAAAAELLNGFNESLNIPSVSEVTRLLPSIIQASREFNYIPEPKRIDKEESWSNLIDHIDDVQSEIDERLTILEDSLVKLEEEEQSYDETFKYNNNNNVSSSSISSKTKAIIQMLLSDLATAKKLIHRL